MRDDNFFWNYKYEPGKKLKRIEKNNKNIKPLVSIVTSYYNGNEYMWQTINCVLNQTFQSWEWIIVDDGSTDLKAIEYLKEIENIDNRIRIYHKKNEGLAIGRDYAIDHSNTNYILPLDSDDLIEDTYIETLYWTLETNKSAAWAYTNSVGFGKYIYLSDVKFDSDKMKTDNHITATALIRKEKILNIGGYRKAKRYVNEDWHLWLRLLAKNEFPIHVGFYGFWYRRRERSLLTDINNKESKKYNFKMRDLKIEADKIKGKIEAIEYPQNKKINSLNNKIIINTDYINILNNQKKSVVYIIPYLGTDNKMYNIIKKIAKNKQIYIIITQINKHSQYFLRQKYEKFAIIYDLTTFIDSQYWIDFIKYIINSRNTEKIYVSDIQFKNILKNDFEINEISKFKDSDIVYKMKIFEYKFKKLFVMRIIRKILNKMIG